jgi:hypothetical protein
MTSERIKEVQIEKDEQGYHTLVRVCFGPHYFVELHQESDGKVAFVLGATHHGFKADASQVGGQLECFINEIRQAHPDSMVD